MFFLLSIIVFVFLIISTKIHNTVTAVNLSLHVCLGDPTEEILTMNTEEHVKSLMYRGIMKPVKYDHNHILILGIGQKAN